MRVTAKRPVRRRRRMPLVAWALVSLQAASVSLVSRAAEVPADGWRLWNWEKGWAAQDKAPTFGEKGELVFERRRGKRASLSRTFEVDLGRRPTLEIVTDEGHAHWRLTGQAGSQAEIVLADFQTEGVCRRNVAKRLFTKGHQTVTLRFMMWGWSGPETQRLVLKRVAFVSERAERDATGMSGVMLERHEKAMTRARGIRALVHEHPSLRYRTSQKAELLKKARTTHRIFAKRLLDVIDRLDEEKSKPSYVLGPELLKKGSHAWRGGLLGLRPPEPPTLRPGEGRNPFPGARTEGTWRVLCWHDFSNWVIGSALTDDPAFAEQARRWILAFARWRFWKRADYVYFDFGTSYPLQSFAYGYDIAHGVMTRDERAEVREAMTELARGLYLNTLNGHGSIYNDLRGNHTAVTLCGLGLAGLVLLDEHPEAPRWVALAEQFMLDAFEEHTSGAWTESPSYGNYGVDEWLKLAEALRTVTGRDHLRHPFLERYADFQLMIADWEGRDLGYNQGGWAARWNHWIFFFIAKERRSPEVQWLANFCIRGKDSFGGYGDAFWWADPLLEARRPAGRNVGRTFEDVGVSVWRSGWEDDATILLHHCGRKGQHKEENMNHFTLYAGGRRILPDGVGTRTADHNVPMINGRKQNRWGPGRTLAFHSDDVSGYSLGDATKAYGARSLRHVLYLRSGVLAVVDDIRTRRNRKAALSFRLHANGQTEPAGDGFRVTSADVTLLGAFADRLGNAIPATVTAREARRRATHDVAATREGSGETRTITLLRFGKTSALPGRALRVEKGDGFVDFACGPERLRVGFGPAGMAEGFRLLKVTGAPLWVMQMVNGLPRALLVAADPERPVVLRDPSGKETKGKGCVSWGR